MTPPRPPRPWPRSALLLVLLAALGSLTVFAAEPPSRPAGGAGTAPAPGLDVIQRRPITDPWVLKYQEVYNRRYDADQEQRMKDVVAAARARHKSGQVEVPIDHDQDGVTDHWVYFTNGAPAFVEADRFRTGVRDFRMDVRDAKWRASEFSGWAIEPPIPLAKAKHPDLTGELFDAAFSAGKDSPARPAADLADRLLPGLADGLGALAGRDTDAAARKELADYAARAARLLPRFRKEFEEQKLAEKLKTPWGFRVQFFPHGADGGEGKEVAAGYSPEGVARIQFFRESWLDKKGLLADCLYDKGRLVQVELKGRRYVHLKGHWARVAPKAREAIARAHLLPGLREYRAGSWYPAVEHWQRGTQLAAVLGDLEAGVRGNILDDELSGALADAWAFNIEDRVGFSLLQVAHGMGWRKGAEGVIWLADDAAERRQHDDALALYSLALRLANKLDRAIDQVLILESMGSVHKLRGNYDQAIECFFKALDVESTLAYTENVIDNLGKIANDPNNPQDIRRAIAVRSHAMALNRGCKLATIAALYADLGESENAKSYFAEAERVLRGLGNPYAEADLLNLRAKWDLAEGRWELALERLDRAWQSVKDRAVAQKADAKRGREYYNRGHTLHTFQVNEGSRSYLMVGMTSPSHPRSYEALTAGLIGEAHLQAALATDPAKPDDRKRSLEESEKWQKIALAAYEEAKDDMGLLVTRLRLAIAAFHRQDYQTAQSLAEQVEKESRVVGAFETTWRARALRGAVAAALGRADDALGHYRNAAAEIESLRAAMHSEPARLGFFGARVQVYEEMARLHHARKEDEQVWDCMERARARSLLDVMGGQELAVKGREVTQLAHDQPLLLQFIRTGTSPGGREGATDLQKAHRTYMDSIADRPLMQEVASLRSVNPVRLRDVQAVLGPNTLLVEFFFTERELLAALVTARGLKVVAIPGYGRAKVEAEVEEFRKHVQDPRRDCEPIARRLYRDLLAPCLEGQGKVDHLCIVPAGALHYLPFHALMHEGGEYLVERQLVSYASSASALVYSVHRRAAGTKAAGRTVVVGEPRPVLPLGHLPHAALEGRRVHAAAGGPKVLLEGKSATESAVLAELPTAGCFHFAGHTELLPRAPLRTALLCTPDPDADGRLEVRDLFGLNLRGCELAVLSACETLQGRWHQGDEIVGLTRAFLRAGVPTVVASLWQVPDESTFRLMVRFHELRAKPGTSKMEALARAQREYLADGLREIRLTDAEQVELERRRKEAVASGRGVKLVGDGPPPKAGKRPHPFYWAAFALQGDWR